MLDFKKKLFKIMNKIKSIITILFASVTVLSCTDLHESLYSEVDRNSFYNNKNEVTAAVLRSYEHAATFYRSNDLFFLEELTADQFVISQKGQHWYDQGRYIRLHRHEWTSEEPAIYNTWRSAWIGISLCNTLLEELSDLDYSEIPGGLTPEDQQRHLAEMRVLRPTYYYHLVSLWGTDPISEVAYGTPRDPSSILEVINWVDQDLEEASEYLPMQSYIEAPGRLNQAAAKHLLARFYLNSERWTGESKYDEVERISLNLIEGVYGNYELDDTFYGPFVHNNGENSTEIIFGFPRSKTFTAGNLFSNFYHPQSRRTFGTDAVGPNGVHLQPSRKPPVAGEHYTPRESQPNFRPEEDYDPISLELYQWEPGIGNPYELFHDDDLRKKNFNFEGDIGIENKNFDTVVGMFLHGAQESTNTITGETAIGANEYSDYTLVYVDFVARASQGQSSSSTPEGEENSGVRLVKYPVYPSSFEGDMNSDYVEYRLAEVYYMLAESLIRQGKPGAADYINLVKQRNFESYSSHAYTDSELDLDVMLSEWGREFLGEKRRRTDLIRFGKFNSEWWDKEVSSEHRQLFPYPAKVLSSNPNLEQNEGY